MRKEVIEMPNRRYIAIIGDIVDSKKVNDRGEFQKKFKALLEKINQKYAKNISSKFMITLGDEFQGLLGNSENLFEIIFEIEKEIKPVKIRFGVGIGQIHTEISHDFPLGADGPAYHYARKMVERLKSSEGKYKNSPNNILIATSNNECDSLIDSVLELSFAIKSKWTARQAEIIEKYKENNENQYKVAEQLKISQSTVNKAIKSSLFYQYNNGINSIKQYLQKGDEVDV